MNWSDELPGRPDSSSSLHSYLATAFPFPFPPRSKVLHYSLLLKCELSTRLVQSLRVWDNSQGKWYVYAPSLEAQGGTTLADDIASKGYLDFTANNRLLGGAIGFRVYKQ